MGQFGTRGGTREGGHEPGRRGPASSPAGGRCALPILLSLLLPGLLLSGAATVWANGGTLRLANVSMGEYLVSVFTDPTPVRPDSLDVSVLVLREGVPGVAEDVQVTVRTRLVSDPGPGEVREATREQADDPRYHATKFGLGAEGEWEITVAVAGPGGEGEASFQLRARKRGLLGHPLVLTLLALLPLLLVATWIFREGEDDRGGGDPLVDHPGPGARITPGVRPGGTEAAPAPPGRGPRRRRAGP